MEKLIELGKTLGLDGNDLRQFVLEQQEMARADRAAERAAEREIAEREREATEREREREAAEREREREAAEREREAAVVKENAERAERAAEREYELEKIRLMSAQYNESNNTAYYVDSRSKEIRGPKMPCFVDGKDNLDSYLLRFERYVKDSGRPRETWANTLSVLLSGRALEVYSRLNDEDAKSYEALKRALLQRYDLTETGYRKKFRNSRPEWDETPGQFITRLSGYLKKWVELSGIENSVGGMENLFIKEQFMNSCSNELSAYLNTNPTTDLNKLSSLADNYIDAHGKKSFMNGNGKPRIDSNNKPRLAPHSKERNDNFQNQCHNCGKNGHKTANCWGQASGSNIRERRCFICQQPGHLANTCNKRTSRRVEASVGVSDNQEQVPEVSCALLKQNFLTPIHVGTNDECTNTCTVPQTYSRSTDNSCTNDVSLIESKTQCDPVQLMTDEQSNIFESSYISDQVVNCSTNMPVVSGRANGKIVDVLRDSGCNTILVKDKFILPGQYTGEFRYLKCVHNTLNKTPVAMIKIDTPFLSGVVEALGMQDASYDLIIGNVRNVKDPFSTTHDSELLDYTGKNENVTNTCNSRNNSAEEVPFITENNVSENRQTTEACSALNLQDNDFKENIDISREDLIIMQKEDSTLKNIISRKETWSKGKSVIRVINLNGIWYREFVHPNWNLGNPVKQVLLPEKLRNVVLTIAHESTLGAHMGIGKTLDKIQSCFFWPGIHADISRFVRSCDKCQKTVRRGTVPKASLGRMPIIGVCWERIGVDLVGPISPASERGHRYILTIIDYATRYPEAIPLRNCSTEDVAEALFEVYCRLGIPNEILSDMGRQFTSDCMQRIAELLGIKQLHTSICHPMTNGLVEKYNGTMKNMLRRLCSKEPKQWDRYLGALLFAYREVPQESTGFSPFELLYGRNVRGPMQILKELWTKEISEKETKNTYQYVFELKEKIGQTLDIAHENLTKAQKKQGYYYDRKARQRSFEVGDEVLVMLPTEKNKLLMQWKGPFRIINKKGTLDYDVVVHNKTKTYHINLLKPYVRRASAPVHKDMKEFDDNPNYTDHVANVAVLDACESLEEEAGDLVDLPDCRSTESIKDVQLAEGLNTNEKHQLMKLLEKYKDVITDSPGKCNLIEHKIPLIDDVPIASRPYPVPYSVRQSLDKEINDMLDLGIIRVSESPYASPVVIVKKKDGSNRVCIDFRKLNKITVGDPEPMPLISDMLHNIGNDRYFSKLDLTKGYWQIAMAEEDIKKTAFVTHNGKYEFVRMPFGTKSAGATLTRCMRKLLQGIDNVHSYIDDILIHTEDWEEHIRTLEKVFICLQNAGFTVKPSKCEFGSDSVEFVGYRVGRGIVEITNANAKKIAEAQRPSTKKEVRAFVALTGFYRDFIPNFSEKASALTDLTKNKMPNKVKWNDAAEESYNTLKSALQQEPILRLYDIKKSIILRTDASDSGVGAALLQEHAGKLFPVSYASRKLLQRETRYSVIEKECLAITWAIKKFELYLFGREFIIQTDHNSLTYIDRSKFENARVMRWAMFLQQYSFRIEMIKGNENIEADFLSRVGW